MAFNCLKNLNNRDFLNDIEYNFKLLLRLTCRLVGLENTKMLVEY